VKPLDQFVEEVRERRPLPMRPRERRVFFTVAAAVGTLTLVAAFLLPWNRDFQPLLAVALVLVYAVLASVMFEIGRGFATADQLVLVAMLYLMPLPVAVPLIVLGYLLSDLPSVLARKVHPDRLVQSFGNVDGALAAAVAVALIGPHVHGADAAGVFAIAFAVQIAVSCSVSFAIYRLAFATPPRIAAPAIGFGLWIDTLLWPFAMLVAVGADSFPAAVLAPLALAWLLHAFSRERAERYGAALELNRAYRGTVTVLTDVVESEDSYTADHSRSVVSLAEAVADELRVPLDDRQELEFAARLHDVGKLAIPREILHKPSSLTREEFELIKTHTLEGERILARAGGLLARVGKLVRSCHERWDGGGYPDGLAGEEIPLPARIVFCCDAYNAMTTDRPYRDAMPRDAALAEIAANAGTQFDPQAASALTAVVLRGGHDGEPDRADAVRAMLAAV
jgi:HD-GYP domain-containing protein (c-di-GMP phosphodiesterase class II)